MASQFLIGLSKAIADMVDHKDNWDKSVFSTYDVYSFFGPKTHTWKRKNKGLLFKTILVGSTDIWHMANTLRLVGWVSFVCLTHMYSLPICLVFFGCFFNRLIFHTFYHYLLRKNEK